MAIEPAAISLLRILAREPEAALGAGAAGGIGRSGRSIYTNSRDIDPSNERTEKSSFLKKRTKKLLSNVDITMSAGS